MKKIGTWNFEEVKSVCLFCPECGNLLYNETVDNGGDLEDQREFLKGGMFYCHCGAEYLIVNDDEEDED